MAAILVTLTALLKPHVLDRKVGTGVVLEMRGLLYVQLAQAVKVAHMRGSHTVNMDDIMFLLRKDKVHHKCFSVCITATVV